MDWYWPRTREVCAENKELEKRIVMKLFRTEDQLVSKYVHDDGSETAIKCVSSCDTIKNPISGELEINSIDRNKYSIFVSASAGCFMKCDFCYLTMKEMKYQKLTTNQVLQNLKDAISDRKSTRLNSSHTDISRMPSSA